MEILLLIVVIIVVINFYNKWKRQQVYNQMFALLVASHLIAKNVAEAAMNGDPDAQYIIGKTYLEDIEDDSENLKKGLWWIAQAANNGHLQAQCLLKSFDR